MVGCIPGRGGTGEFYDDDKNENGDDDNDHNNYDDDEDNQRPCHFSKALPMQSPTTTTVRTTTSTWC